SPAEEATGKAPLFRSFLTACVRRAVPHCAGRGAAMGLFPKRRDDQPAGEQPAPIPPAAPPRRILPPAGRPPGSVTSSEMNPHLPPPMPPPVAPAPPAVPSSVPRPMAVGAASQRGELPTMLSEAARLGASDLHLTRNLPPMVRVDGH